MNDKYFNSIRDDIIFDESKCQILNKNDLSDEILKSEIPDGI